MSAKIEFSAVTAASTAKTGSKLLYRRNLLPGSAEIDVQGV